MIKLTDEYGEKVRGYLKKIDENLWEFDPKYVELPHETRKLKEPEQLNKEGLKDWIVKFDEFLKNKNTDENAWVGLRFLNNTGDIQFCCYFSKEARKPEFPWRVCYKVRNGASDFWPYSPDYEDDHLINSLDGFHEIVDCTSEKHIRTYMAEIQAEVDSA